MPFKSKAQRRKFYAMANRGEIDEETVKEWEEETGDKELPEKVDEDKDEKKKKDAFVRKFVRNFYNTVGMDKQAFERTGGADLLIRMAGLIEKKATVTPMSYLRVPEQISRVLWPSLAAYATGVGAGRYTGSLFSPSAGSIDNLYKEETLAALDQAIDEVKSRTARRRG